MFKKILISFLFFVFLVLTTATFYVLDYPRATTINQEKVAYNLPYPGILPDHPLYFIKLVRDKIIEFTTRDNLKKARLYLLASDKRAAMTMPLVKKGKGKLAITTISKGEKYFLQIPLLIETAKKQGDSPDPGLMNDLKVSNAKHQEIIESLLKELPQGQIDAVNEVLKINQEIKKELEKM